MDREEDRTLKHKKDILFLCQFFYPEYISSAQLPYDTVRALKNEGDNQVLGGFKPGLCAKPL